MRIGLKNYLPAKQNSHFEGLPGKQQSSEGKKNYLPSGWERWVPSGGVKSNEVSEMGGRVTFL